MNANQLRINNLVLRNGKPYPITFNDFAKHGIELACDYDTTIHFDELQPIPLTEEWLFKFRFKLCGNFWGNNNKAYWFGENPVTFDWIIQIKTVGNIFFYMNGFFKMFYVHQLQNLYFALTGEELNIIEL